MLYFSYPTPGHLPQPWSDSVLVNECQCLFSCCGTRWESGLSGVEGSLGFLCWLVLVFLRQCFMQTRLVSNSLCIRGGGLAVLLMLELHLFVCVSVVGGSQYACGDQSSTLQESGFTLYQELIWYLNLDPEFLLHQALVFLEVFGGVGSILGSETAKEALYLIKPLPLHLCVLWPFPFSENPFSPFPSFLPDGQWLEHF